MKKLFTFLLLFFFSVVCYSQFFARAHSFTLGKRDFSSNQIVWSGQPKPCNILIEIQENSIIIHSNTVQYYHVINKLADTPDGMMYRVVDTNSQLCNFFMGPLQNGFMYMAIEYNDYSWMYTCTDESDK